VLSGDYHGHLSKIVDAEQEMSPIPKLRTLLHHSIRVREAYRLQAFLINIKGFVIS